MIQSHYRSPVDYSDASLKEARAALIRGYTALQQIKETLLKVGTPEPDHLKAAEQTYRDKLNDLQEKFKAALDDDFNTAQALGYVFEAARLTNNITTAEKKMPVAAKKILMDHAQDIFAHFGDVLGVFQSDPDVFFREDRSLEVAKRGLDVDRIDALIARRKKAREDKDWSLADDIRKELASLHILLKDAEGGTTWSIE